MNSKKFAEAQARFAQALTENPRFAEAHNYLGYSLQMEGTQNYLMALEHYNRAIQLKPNLAQAYEYRGALLLNMDRKRAAEKDLATLKTLNPGLAVEVERVMKKGERSERVRGETRRLDPLILSRRSASYDPRHFRYDTPRFALNPGQQCEEMWLKIIWSTN